jgi:uncharacterized membrane protein YphA (DoxX/SURF4 family)
MLFESTIRRVSRPLLASMFIYGGIDSVRHPDAKAKRADSVTGPLADLLPIPDDPVALVRFNGAVQVGAGSALALGKFPRLAALVLAGSLVPTTLAGHRFWEEDDPQAEARQRIQFFKNLSMLGGLLIAATAR